MERKLRRSKKERVFLGVLGGIAEYLEIDPVLVRLLYLLLFIFNPAAMTVFYFLAAIIMPSEDEEEEDVEKRVEHVLDEVRGAIKSDSGEEGKLVGTILLILGIILLAEEFAPVGMSTKTLLALALLGLGLLLLLRGDGE